jgi:hypothetical protein
MTESPFTGERDQLYLGHMLDMARKAVELTRNLDRAAYDENETLRLALVHLVQVTVKPPATSRPNAKRRIQKSPGDRSSACDTRSFTTTWTWTTG